MKLYVYDHCPYCVKARMIFGYKNIPFELITLLNDDEKTPIDMIGQKMVPILSDGNSHMPESLDIISKIDKSDNTLFIIDTPVDSKLEAWLSEARSYLYPLAMPRWVKSDLEEFETPGAIEYFKKKKEDYIGPFSEHLEKTSSYLKEANTHLLKLNDLLSDTSFYSGESASINDIHLYPTLRSLSIVEGISYPEKVMSYMKKQEELTRVPLHLDIAL
ncbi:MAG: glutaredoxin 2 [Bdellovibrionales bacterium]